MMRTVILGTLVLLAVLPAAAGAQARRAPRWTRIGTTSAGNAIFLDGRSVRRERGIVTATLRAVFTPPVRSPRGDINSSRTIARFDCARRTVAVVENWMYHDERRGTVFEHRKPGLPGYGSPIRGTVSEVALNHLCTSP